MARLLSIMAKKVFPAGHLWHLFSRRRSPKTQGPNTRVPRIVDTRKTIIFSRNPVPRGVLSPLYLSEDPQPLQSFPDTRRAQTHIVLRGPTQDTGFALYALPLVGLNCLGHIQSELQASWMTWKKPEQQG